MVVVVVYWWLWWYSGVCVGADRLCKGDSCNTCRSVLVKCTMCGEGGGGGVDGDDGGGDDLGVGSDCGDGNGDGGVWWAGKEALQLIITPTTIQLS